MQSRIAVIATGGTIASTTTTGGVVASRTASALVDELDVSGVVIETVDLMTVGSYNLTFEHLRSISDCVAELLAREVDPVDGIVITHGTDTLEETAILLDLVHDDPRAVVMTGAQRAHDALDGDGPRNLRDAIDVAASPDARDLGVLVVFAGDVLAARGTRKLHTTALAAFGSTAHGGIGTVGGGQVCVTSVPRRPKPLARPTAQFDTTRVDLVEMYLGADGVFVNAAVAAGAAGIVLAGTGVGNANESVTRTVTEALATGIVVVLSTRVPEGPVAGVYGNGGGADLIAAGVPAASGLPATQLRILLALWLSQRHDRSEAPQSAIDIYSDNKEL
ncbi:L-asparaginase [Rhodococcus sp. Leaf7]|uniref:asparaginase n=1 Tax=unclassified Rhodococcus (in: high G+C Gram-positive bacteria) TaxID=192944 RepID=UPI0006F5D660|nr:MULTISPECIES: asparaginase [unclassified Rhodococcus (in: high G+C Gram-positive bacteria)]KQU01919.1 L-asparaginase [Rhodococcus sp. Leaf7]KQU38212.1 L-asparaginase [Rhodococcus sp. Leaf247]